MTAKDWVKIPALLIKQTNYSPSVFEQWPMTDITKGI